jgi:hypothetical protein
MTLTKELPLDRHNRPIIRLPRQSWFAEHGVSTVPGYLWRSQKFSFAPNDYILENDRLQTKTIGSEKQIASLNSFISDVTQPLIYGVGAEPSDQKALYFAAYLTMLYVMGRGLPGGRSGGLVRWETLNGGFKNRLLYEDGSIDQSIGFLVLTNVTPESSSVKLEKLRDTLVAYADIPRIVVIGGMDPVTFFSTKIFHRMTHLFFHSAALVKRKHEVI